jgi:hypothetical protein
LHKTLQIVVFPIPPIPYIPTFRAPQSLDTCIPSIFA